MGGSVEVGQQLLGESISCQVASMGFEARESSAVKISPWDTPRLISSNLAPALVQRENPGIINNGKVEIGAQLKLNCIAIGNPQPRIHWLMQVPLPLPNDLAELRRSWPPFQSNGNERAVSNATCVTSQSILARPGQRYNPGNGNVRVNIPNTVFVRQPFPVARVTKMRRMGRIQVVRSECTVTVANYSFAGSYWCSACNQVSATSQHCEPAADRPASPSVALGVVGAPKQANSPPTATQDAEGAIVSTYYCADPPPEARNIFWTIGGERVNIGQTLGRYKAEPPTQNGTSCFTARLRIAPLTEEDISKPYVLSVQNRFGSERINVDVRSLLLSEADAAAADADVGLIVGLTLGILFFLCLVIPACMWWRGLGCFAGPRKAPPEKYATKLVLPPSPHLISGLILSPFSIAPETVRTEPAPVQNNGYNPQNDVSQSS